MKRHGIVRTIQGDDPEWNPEQIACDNAGIKIEDYQRAKSYLWYDGNYGPYEPSFLAQEEIGCDATDEEIAAYLAPPFPFRTRDEALEIIHEVYVNVPSHSSYVYLDCWDSCEEDCEGDHETLEEDASGTDIAHDLFGWYHEIYGAYP